MSRSCGRATAQNFPEFAQNLENCMRKPIFFFSILTTFSVFFYIIHKYYVLLDVIIALFLAQNFKMEVLTAQKNLLLECMWLYYP